MYDKRAYHVDPTYKAERNRTHFCDVPQALVNVCLTCPLPMCRPEYCRRYVLAKRRYEKGIFPLVDAPIPEPVILSKCEQCEFGCDVGGKVFCPLVKCVKEE